MLHTISPKMAAGIERAVGMPIEDIRHKSLHEVHESIEKQIGHPLKLGYEPGGYARGSMHIQFGRTITSEELEKQMRKYFR